MSQDGRLSRVRWVNNFSSTVPWVNNDGQIVKWN